MSVCKQAARKRRQAANNYRHMAPQKRPHYLRRDAATASERLARLIEREKARKLRQKK